MPGVRRKARGTLEGWGRQSVAGSEVRSEDLVRATRDAPLSRGLGRSYGDASLPPPGAPRAVNTTRADRILAFDERTGRLRAEAGLSLFELNRVLMPRGWFTPVTPGTQFVTLGGMVAADIHGKNQHAAGDFGDHVTALRMRVADGRVLECRPTLEPELFAATLGGMGLTGHILEVEAQWERIPSPWIHQYSRRIDDLDAFQQALVDAAADWPFTVGWIDSTTRGAHLGRGVLMCGRWAEPSEAPARFPRSTLSARLPVDLPGWALGRTSVRAFNELYYSRHGRREAEGLVRPEAFFYPLDALRDWNRAYGPRGFTQYQCVLPHEAGPSSARRLMEVLTSRGGASFLTVIKDFGREGPGLLSFPRPGITLALDIPVRDDTQALVDALNETVLDAGGRIYLAKDAFTRREHFRAMEAERLPAFEAVRDAWDPSRRLRSALSVRLFGDPA